MLGLLGRFKNSKYICYEIGIFCLFFCRILVEKIGEGKFIKINRGWYIIYVWIICKMVIKKVICLFVICDMFDK